MEWLSSRQLAARPTRKESGNSVVHRVSGLQLIRSRQGESSGKRSLFKQLLAPVAL